LDKIEPMTLHNKGQKIILVSNDPVTKPLLTSFLQDKYQLTLTEEFDECTKVLNSQDSLTFFDCILLDINSNFEINEIFYTYQLLLKASPAVGLNAVIILVSPPDNDEFEPEELSLIRRELLETVNGVQEVFYKDNLVNKLAGLNRCITDAISRNTSRKKTAKRNNVDSRTLGRPTSEDSAVDRLLSKLKEQR